MTKDELKKEAEDYAEQYYGWTNNDYALDVAKTTYIASAEPRESRIAELKTDYEVLSCSVGDFGELQDRLEEEQRKNNGLEEQLTKAKELLNEFMRISKASDEDFEHDYSELIGKAEQFLKDIEK